MTDQAADEFVRTNRTYVHIQAGQAWHLVHGPDASRWTTLCGIEVPLGATTSDSTPGGDTCKSCDRNAFDVVEAPAETTEAVEEGTVETPKKVDKK